mmetsp:Transcript_29602/g.94807  ORF Transcript_29602/g.94807 Transcript_29602/m.94807 type:complete len:219 (-) Transcript_29602:1060-1716(-)
MRVPVQGGCRVFVRPCEHTQEITRFLLERGCLRLGTLQRPLWRKHFVWTSLRQWVCRQVYRKVPGPLQANFALRPPLPEQMLAALHTALPGSVQARTAMWTCLPEEVRRSMRRGVSEALPEEASLRPRVPEQVRPAVSRAVHAAVSLGVEQLRTHLSEALLRTMCRKMLRESICSLRARPGASCSRFVLGGRGGGFETLQQVMRPKDEVRPRLLKVVS